MAEIDGAAICGGECGGPKESLHYRVHIDATRQIRFNDCVQRLYWGCDAVLSQITCFSLSLFSWHAAWRAPNTCASMNHVFPSLSLLKVLFGAYWLNTPRVLFFFFRVRLKYKTCFKIVLNHYFQNKKHLKNVAPIRRCEPFYIAIRQVSLLSHAATVARRLRIDVHDNDDDDNDNNNDNA